MTFFYFTKPKNPKKIQDRGGRHIVFSGYVNLTIPAC